MAEETIQEVVETAAPAAEAPAPAVEQKKPEGRRDIFAELGLVDDDEKVKILKAKGSKGISMFIVDMKLPGVSLGKHEEKMGIHGYPTSDVVLEDVRVGKDCLVGPLHKGFQYAMKTLDGGRLGMAAQAVGVAQSALDEAVKYAKERKQFGRRIADFQGVSFMIAEMAADVEAARQLVYHAAELKDKNMDATAACSIAKYFAAEAANRCAYKAVQIHGGDGCSGERRVGRVCRGACRSRR